MFQRIKDWWLQRQFDSLQPEDCRIRFCGNCHDVLYVWPEEAMDQVFDGEGLVLCNCGAPFEGISELVEWTP